MYEPLATRKQILGCEVYFLWDKQETRFPNTGTFGSDPLDGATEGGRYLV